ncbi:MAG: endonuclease MutS2, partial [Nitrospinota bacterium]
MTEGAAAALEFDAFRALLAACAASEPGAEAIRGLVPSDSPREIRRRFDRVAEMRRLLSEGPVPLGAFGDLRTWLPRLKEGAEPLAPERLLGVAEAVEQGAAVRGRLAEAEDACPRLLSDVPDLSDLPAFASRIRRSIEPDGRVSDAASPRLRGIRRSLRSLREEIRSALESRMSRWSEALQEPLVLIRRDRYAIPVKTGFRRVLQGIILDQSASGQTLYVEPLLIQSENDRLAELRVEETTETYRILQELTDRVRDARASLEALVGWLVEFDVLLSMARFADAYGAVEPEMGEGVPLRLRRARHPLLERQKGRDGVVPLDLGLEGGRRQVVITGANTGGKTVALKTVGLLALLAHTGCPVPAAEGTRIPYLDQVFAEIGDDQSLVQNLSTFSAHLAHQ